MRKIEFRGYCDRDSEWRYGYYITDGKIHEINTLLPDDKTLYGSQIDLESLGQNTGLKDKNNKDIFEGDIVKNSLNDILQIVWDEDGCCFEMRGKYKYSYKQRQLDCDIIIDLSVEVIGTNFMNPELLK